MSVLETQGGLDCLGLGILKMGNRFFDRSAVVLIFAPPASGLILHIFRQMLDTDHSLVAKDESVFNKVLKFSHVARKLVTHEKLHNVRRDPCELLTTPGVEAIDEVFDQIRNIFAPLAQRRDRDPHNRQTEIQVIAKFALTDHVEQLLVGRSHNPDIGMDGLDSAERFIFTLLQKTQQLDLRHERQLTDLIEENSSPFGKRHAPCLVLLGIGEGAFQIAE